MSAPRRHEYFSRGTQGIIQTQRLGQAMAIVGCLTGWIDLAPNFAGLLSDVPGAATVAEVLRDDTGWEIRVPIIGSFPIRWLTIEMFLADSRHSSPAWHPGHSRYKY